MRSNNRILIAPLDWGLGHASRCIPIIRHLQSLNAIPVLAGDGQSLDLLRMEFPELEFHLLPNLKIDYPEKGSFYLYFLFRFRKMMTQIRDEHKALHKLLEEVEVNGIISDNRYGIYSSNIPSVLLSHQLNPKAGIFSPLVSRLIHRLINRFDHCWIPDYEGENSMAGSLSNAEKSGLNNIVFIGPLSRLHPGEQSVDKAYKVLAILSGPEPQRSLLEKELLNKLSVFHGKHIVVRGTSDKRDEVKNGDIEVFDILTSSEIQDVINKSEYIISRSGYSSIMDFVQLERNALLIPTPGQSEQEYLSRYHSGKQSFVIQNQGEVNLEVAVNELSDMLGFESSKKNQDLNQILVDFLDSLY